MKSKLQKFSIILVFLLVVSVGLNIAAALPDGAEPGSEQDPLISKSYVDKMVADNTAEVVLLKQQLEEQKKLLDELKNQQQTGGSEGFIVLTLEAGQTLLPGAGSEIILRSGNATGVSGQNNDNLADVTSAKDIVKGAAIVKNHLLISSRDDGRGLKATNPCYLLVRGAYKVNEPQHVESSVDVKPPQGENSENQEGNSSTPSENEPPKGKVSASALNVRSEPNTTATILAKAYKGDLVTILSSKGDWVNIKTSAGVEGWVLSQYVVKQ